MKKQNDDVVDIMNSKVEEPTAKVDEIVTTDVQTTPDETAKVEEQKTPDEQVKVEESKAAESAKETKVHKRGMVFNCAALRVRKEPSFDCEVVETINKGSSVTINDEESTNEFYRVATRSGVVGFCSKQFIKLL